MLQFKLVQSATTSSTSAVPVLELLGSLSLYWCKLLTSHHRTRRPFNVNMLAISNFICIEMFESFPVMLIGKHREYE